jgi:hypothetical protein
MKFLSLLINKYPKNYDLLNIGSSHNIKFANRILIVLVGVSCLLIFILWVILFPLAPPQTNIPCNYLHIPKNALMLFTRCFLYDMGIIFVLVFQTSISFHQLFTIFYCRLCIIRMEKSSNQDTHKLLIAFLISCVAYVCPMVTWIA